jgi:hypothetical protein
MGNRIAVNAKYYKASEVSGEQGHIMRLFAKNKNVYEHLTKDNFGTSDHLIDDRYKAAFKDVKNLKKTSNTLIDAVFVFPLEQWEKARENGMTNEDVERVIWKTMTDIEQATGLQPCGFKMHLDEGRTLENGEIELNTHAHMQFANICNKDVTLKRVKKLTMKGEDGSSLPDPDKPKRWLYQRDENGKIKTEKTPIKLKNKMPLQYLRGRGADSVWAAMQDLAAKNMHEFGFIRGVSKEITNAVHLEKQQWIASELKRQEARAEQLEQKNNLLQTTNEVLEHTSNKLKVDYNDLSVGYNDLSVDYNDLKVKHAARLKALRDFYQRVRTFATAAMRGDIATLKEQLPPIVKLFDVDIPDENKADSLEYVNEAIDDISDSIEPVVKPFAQKLQDTMAEVIEEKDQENPTPLKSKPLPPRP